MVGVALSVGGCGLISGWVWPYQWVGVAISQVMGVALRIGVCVCVGFRILVVLVNPLREGQPPLQNGCTTQKPMFFTVIHVLVEL